MGVELSFERRQSAATPGNGTTIGGLPACCRSRLDLCQDRAEAISGARRSGRPSVTLTVEKTKLHALLGDYPNTTAIRKGEVTSNLVDFDFADVKVSNTAFKPLVREARLMWANWRS